MLSGNSLEEDTVTQKKMPSREEAVMELVSRHFDADPYIIRVFWISAERDASQDEPIKLLEVDDADFLSGPVKPFTFRLAADSPFLFAIALISPENLARSQDAPGTLPEGWNLATARVFERPTDRKSVV